LWFFDFQTNLWWEFDEAYMPVEVIIAKPHYHHNQKNTTKKKKKKKKKKPNHNQT
jgi:hypothetical protein